MKTGVVRIFACLLAVVFVSLAFTNDPMPPAESLEGAFPAQDHYSPYGPWPTDFQ